MSTFVKPYPRAKVSRHKTLDGWVIDLILKANAKPIRVNATYASIAWAHKAANNKLGVKDANPQALAGRRLIVSDEAPAGDRFDESSVMSLTGTAAKPKDTRDYGTCDTCHRPMRPAGSKSADYPGTTLRQRAGLCQSCNNKAKATA